MQPMPERTELISAHHAAQDAQEMEAVQRAVQEDNREDRREQHLCAAHHLIHAAPGSSTRI